MKVQISLKTLQLSVPLTVFVGIQEEELSSAMKTIAPA